MANWTERDLMEELEDSLRRLKTDVIDIYQVHWPDESVPFEETARTLDAFRSEGKIRAIGISNFSPVQMDQFRKGAPLATIQPPTICSSAKSRKTCCLMRSETGLWCLPMAHFVVGC